MHRKLYHTLLCALCVGADAVALTDAWTVDVRQHGAVQRTYKQGETHDLTVTLRDGLKPIDLTGATAHFYWYTNATDNLWWTNAAAVSPSGLVTASWTPAMDTGAASYNWWIGIWQAGATFPLWRVTGTIRMLPSPGFEPNALPMPVRTLDLAAVIVTNAPWVTAADLQAVSNALAAYATTQQVAEAAAAIPRDRITTQDGSRYIDATGGVWRVYSAEAGWRLTLPQQTEPVIVGMIDWDNEEGYVEYVDMGFWGMSITTDGDLYDISYTSGDGNWRSTGVAPVSPIELQPYENGAVGTVTLWYSGPVVTQRVDGVAWQSDVDGKATFDQVMDILNYLDGTKLNTTNGVARSLSVTGGLHVYDGIYLNDVLFVPGEDGVALTIYTNASGAATSWWQVASGVTNSGTFASGATNITDGVMQATYTEATRTLDISNLLAGVSVELPDGIVTNGADGPLALAGIGLTNGVLRAASGRLGRITLDDNGIADGVWGTVFSTQSAQQLSIVGSAEIGGFYDYSSRFYGCQGGSQKILELYDWKYGPRTAYFDHDGSLMSSGTVYAAEVRSQSGYLLPHLGTNTTISLIFTNGTLQAWEIAQ